MNPVWIALIAALGACAILAAVLVLRRSGRWSRVPPHVEVDVSPVLHRALDDGYLDHETIASLTPAERQALERKARTLIVNLRGADRAALASLLQRLGTIEDARRRTVSRHAHARARAGTLLAETGSSSALPELIKLLDDRDPSVRWSAAQGLGRLGDPNAVMPLFSCLEGKHSLPADVVVEAIVRIRTCPLSVLRQGTRSRSVSTRAVSVELLGRFQDLSARDHLIRLLRHDPSSEVQARAARALGHIASPSALEPLLWCVEHGPAAARAQAVWALGQVGAPGAVPMLHLVLLGPSLQLRDQAAEALAAVGPAGISVLSKVAEGHHDASDSARRALSVQQHPELSST